MTCGDIFLGVLAVLFPPIAVWIKRGICSADSLINILLSSLGYLPGLIHAWYIIAKFPDEGEYGYEIIPEDGQQRDQNGRVTYYYVSREPLPVQRGGGSLGSSLPPAHPSPPPAKTTGAPDAGRAQREQARQGPALGGPAATASGNPPRQIYRDDPPQDGATPPTYAEAVKGDNKVQTDSEA